MPTNLVAQSQLDLRTVRCQLAIDPTSQNPCQPLANTIMPQGVAVLVALDGRSVLVDGIRVAGKLDLNVPRDLGSIMAQDGQDILTTGSIEGTGRQN
jgi:hypothetical protein